MKQLQKILWTAAFLFAAALSSAAPPVTFGGLDVNTADDLLFTASQNYRSLFVSHLTPTGAAGEPRLLTCYPERLLVLDGGRTLRIQNRYGSAQYVRPSAGKDQSLSWTAAGGELLPCAASPDGKWLCAVNRLYTAVGQLVLQNALTGEELVLVDSLPFALGQVPAKWSPDSRFLLYEREGAVYFVNPELAFKEGMLSEEYRRVGGGTIASVEWTRSKSLVYIDGDIIYRIQENELHIRGLYSYFIGSGSIVGRLLYAFDAAKDSFWCNEDGTQLVINTADKFVSYCTVQEEGYDFVKPVMQVPLNAVPGSPLGCRVFWPQGGTPLLWVDYIPYRDGATCSDIYLLANVANSAEGASLLLTVEDSIEPQLAPDGRHLAFSEGSELLVYRLDDWKRTVSLGGERLVNAAWASPAGLYAGGEQTVRLVEFDDAVSPAVQNESVLFLSSVSTASWSVGRILARSSATSPVYLYDAAQNCWSRYDKDELEAPRQNNERFRVFLGESENSLYSNTIFVRPLGSGAYTYVLTAQTQQPAPELQKVALAFDVLDSADGLANVLATLRRFDVRATFFINGEFIRRYPQETRQLAKSGHTCASLFSSTVDLLNKNYRLDKDFIRRGLARNEDEFYAATGAELVPLWHAPYHHSNDYIVAAGEESGYVYINASSENAVSPANLIISFTIGDMDERLDLLISSLLSGGYELVGVQDLLAR